MLGLVFGTIFGTGTRLALWAVGLGLWLLTRPGGWAVLAAGVVLVVAATR